MLPDKTLMPVPATDLVDLNMNFGDDEGDTLVKPTLQNNPYLQWFNGLTTTTFETAIGFHIEADVNPLLDEHMTEMGVKRYVVQHKSSNQNGEVKLLPYWALNFGMQPCSLFIVSYGIKSKYEMNKDVTDRCGIAYGWEVVRDRQGKIVQKKGSTEPKRQGRVQFRAFIHELVRNGFAEWFQVSFSGYITDDVLTALSEQFRVLDVYNAYARTKEFKTAPFYGFSLPFLPGPLKMVGPKEGEKSPIYSPLAQVPQQITGKYLLEHRISEELIKYIVDDKVLSDTVIWSLQRSQEINAMGDQPNAASEAGTQTEMKATNDPSLPVVQATPSQHTDVGDRTVNEQELAWITKGYCVGNSHFLKQVCERFQVDAPSQLQVSHYTILQTESMNYTQSH